MLKGGICMVEIILKENGYELDLVVYEIFIKYVIIVNDGIFCVYILNICCVCYVYIVIGFLDVYLCGCIIGVYVRFVFYGVDYLM